MIDKNIELTKGMVVYQDGSYSNRLFRIIKLGRVYATVTPHPGLPQIDRPEKVSFERIRADFSLQEWRAPLPAKCLKSKNRKTILIESEYGIRSYIDIAEDRDPENWVKHNAPGRKYIRTLRQGEQTEAAPKPVKPAKQLMRTKNFGSTCPACGSKNIKYVDTTSSKAGTGRKDTSLCGDCGWLAGFDGIIELEPVPTPAAATKPPRTPAPSVPAILAPAPAAASDMASVPMGLGGGGIPPIPGVGAAAAPKPVSVPPALAPPAAPKPKRRQPAAKPSAKPTPVELTRARELGKAGYWAGKQAPAQDAKILDMCRQRSHDAMMALMTAWSKGWHAEHQIEVDKELLGKGMIMPGMGAAAPKPKRRQPAAKPAAKPKAKKAATKPTKKPKKTAAKTTKAKNGKPAGTVLTAAQKKRLAAKGSITIKRGGKFVTVRG